MYKDRIQSLMLKSEFLFKMIRMAKKNYRKFSVDCLYSYVCNNGKILKIIDESTTINGWKMYKNKELFYNNNNVVLEERTVSKRYIGYLKDVTVLAETEGLIHGEQYLTDRMLWNKAFFDNFLTNNVRALDNNNIIIKSNWNMRVHLERGISLAQLGSNNYFHFTFDVLGRLFQIDTLEECRDWPLLVDSIVKTDERSVELLNYLNNRNREIIWLDRDVSYMVDEIIIPSCNMWIPYKEPSSPYIICNDCIQYIKETVIEKIQPNTTVKKVYIARGNNKRLTNETELIDILSENGFIIFNPDMGTLTDEISIFAGADVIVGCYGAAFTNVIYCKKDVRIMIICPYELQIASGINLFVASGLKDFHMIPGIMQTDGEIVHQSAFRITDEGIKKILKLAEKK